MQVPRPLTPFVRFLAGVSYVPGGAWFLIRKPALWPPAIAPLVAAAVLLLFGLSSGAFWAGRVEQALFGGGLRAVPVWLSFVVMTGLWAGSLSAGAILALAVAFALIGPFFERLSRKVEELSGVRLPKGSRGFKWEVEQSLKTALYFAVGAPVAILLGLVPFLGPFLALGFTAHRLSFQNTDAVLVRRGMGFRKRQAFHRRFWPECLGFGISAVLLFPFLNVFAVTVFIVGATRLVTDLEDVSGEPSDEETAAIVAAEELSETEAPIATP